jgi:glycosyltransferase involved in cell wall biosynthesis
MRICFFANMSAHADWREMFKSIEFYSVDIKLLRELGHEVIECGLPKLVDWNADLYFGWWWGHAPFIMLPAKLRRKPIILTGAFDYSTCQKELPGLCYLDKPKWQKMVMATMLRMADVNMFISQSEHDEVTAHMKVRNPLAVPLAIDTDYYHPLTNQKPADYFFSVSLQSYPNSVRKGLPQTIKAFAKISADYPTTRLVIAGKPGDYTDELVALAKGLGVGDRVEFLGMISQDRKRQAYRECIAYVQPTLYEGFGHAIAEAIACGAPVVSAARGSVPEVAGNHAACVDPVDISAIANAMRSCATSAPSEARRAAGYQWIVDNFSLDTRRKRLAEVIASVTQP